MPEAAAAEELPPLVWLSVFDTGNTKLDGEHRQLLADINDLTRLLCENREWSEVVALSRQLRDECFAHFIDEEAVLVRSKYRKLGAHAREHRYIEKQLDDVLICISGVAQPCRAEIEAVLYLRSTLVHHFFRYDIAYKALLPGLSKVEAGPAQASAAGNVKLRKPG